MFRPGCSAISNAALLLLALAAASGCGSGATEPASGALIERATVITVVPAGSREIKVTLESVGKLESIMAPVVAAETDGKVLEVLVDSGDRVDKGEPMAELDAEPLQLERRVLDADVASLTAEIENGARKVRRYRELKRLDHVASQQLEDVEADLRVLMAKRDAVRARIDVLDDQIGRTRILAPIAGRVEKRSVSAGHYVKRGDPLFELADIEHLRALLPFPETLAGRLQTGLEVSLWTPVAPSGRVQAEITALRPMLGTDSRSLTALVDLPNPGGWLPEASIVGRVVVARHQDAVVVPLQAVVRRPAGEVVYVISDGRALQRQVTVGERLEGLVEIVDGLRSGESVAVEGAAYLTDGAPVEVRGGES